MNQLAEHYKLRLENLKNPERYNTVFPSANIQSESITKLFNDVKGAFCTIKDTDIPFSPNSPHNTQ